MNSTMSSRLPAFTGLMASVFACAVCAQVVDQSQLSRAEPGANGQPFPRVPSLPLLAQEVFQVPPVSERPQVISEGPRIRVSGFELSGAVDRPEYGISTSAINTLLRGQISDQPAQGYTVNELAAIADEVTNYYRERGFVLAQAYVPAQDVRNGVVSIGVIEGRLGGVTVEENRMYRDRVVAAPFSALTGQPVVLNRLEDALRIVQQFPGLDVFGTLAPGQRVGETELRVRVRDEDRFSITPMVDNYGSEFTGDQRFSVQFDINNPFGARDRISGYALKTYNPDLGDYGGLDYELMTRSGRGAFGFGVSNNTFDVFDPAAGVDVGIRGEVDQAHVFYQSTFLEDRTRRISGTVDVASRDAVSHQTGVDPRDELLNYSFRLDFFTAGKNQRGITLAHMRWLFGNNDSLVTSRRDIDLPAPGYVTGGFRKIDFSYQRLQRLGRSHSVLLRYQGQYSGDLLAPIEQFSIGGPANIRAYPVATGLVDKGGFGSVEWIISPGGLAAKSAGRDRRTGQQRYWDEIFQFSFFYDYVKGNVNRSLPFQADSLRLQGAGFAVQFSASERFYIRLDIANPVGSPSPFDLVKAEDRGNTQYFLSASVSF